MFHRFTMQPQEFYETIIAPVFADMAAEALGFNGTLGEFTVMNNVVSSKNIIDIRRHQNIMQRRDASCDIVFKNLFGASLRKVTTTEIYGATKFCKNEFYQGCLKEFREKDPVFAEKILPYFRSAINTDLTTNAYFGDTDRDADPDAQFSTDLFDGVFKWIKMYQQAGIIPAGQSIAIGAVDYKANPAATYNLIKSMYDKQPKLMKTFTKAQLAYYVSSEILEAYEDYLNSTGQGNTNYINDIVTGTQRRAYKGIAILEEPLWTPVITDIMGAEGYAAILTVRGNFIYATDQNYGEDDGSGTDKALIIWFDQDTFTWKYTMFLKSGAQIALPEYIVYAISAFQ